MSGVGKTFKKRMLVASVFLFLLYCGLIARLYYIMIADHEYYGNLAKAQYESISRFPASRGEIRITDRYSENYLPVAVSVKVFTAYANPKRIENVDEFMARAGGLLQSDLTPYKDKLQDKTRVYVPLKKKISADEKLLLDIHKVKGLEFETEYARIYPQKSFLAHVLGFVGYKGNDRVGLYGLEKEYEDVLKGKDGYRIASAQSGFFARPQDVKNAVNGSSMLLTIDKTIQYNAEKIIKEAVTENEADSGSIVVMEPKTGRLIAMAVYPDFDPGEYNKVEDLAVFNNQVVVGDYEPGSVFKPITMAMGLSEGKVTPETKYFDKGSVEIDEFEIKNSDKLSHGYQTMTQVLEKSLNTGMIFVKDQIGNEKFLQYVKKFGFGEITGVDLPESPGSIKNITGNIKVNYHTAAFGQGINVTPIQLARAFCAIANQGLLPVPYVVSSVVSSEGIVDERQPKDPVRVVSAEVAKQVTDMMVSVVDNGHGKKAAVKGYRVAGKTGTAQVAKKNGVGYEEDINIGSFVGFAPADNPKFVALVRVNHPRNVKFAESTAAPAFGKLAKFILDYYGVPPTTR